MTIRPPNQLGKIGKAKWRAIVAANPHLQISDADILTLHCRSWELAAMANERINSEGISVAGPNGMIRQHPAMNVVNECHKQLLRTTEVLKLRPENPNQAADAEIPA